MSRILEALEPPGRMLGPDKHVIVRLSDDDWVNSWTAGARRVTENLRKSDSEDYARGLNIPEHLAQPLAVMCEVAVARHLGIDWDWDKAVWKAKDHNRFRHNADVGTNIEVRRVKYENGAVNLKSNQVGRGLFVFTAFAMPPEYLNVKILGFRNYDEAWDLAKPAVFKGVTSKTKRYLSQNDLLPCTCFNEDGLGHACGPQVPTNG